VAVLSGLILGCALLAACGSESSAAADRPPIPVVFRCDDFCAVAGDPRPAELQETQRGIVEAFRRRSVPLTIGVIPRVRRASPNDAPVHSRLAPDDPTAVLLREVIADGRFEVSLHGLTHAPNRFVGDSEWIGLPRSEQVEGLREGRRILAEALGRDTVSTFAPPWNSFDLNTVVALSETGFTHLSGDVGVVRSEPFRRRSRAERDYMDLAIVPSTCSLLELDAALEGARRDAPGTIVVAIFHPYDFREYRPAGDPNVFLGVGDLDRILAQLSKESVTFSRIRDLPRERIPSARYSAACRYEVLLRLAQKVAPDPVLESLAFTEAGTGHWVSKGRYLTTEAYGRLFWRLLACLAMPVMLLAGTAGLVLGRWARARDAARSAAKTGGVVGIAALLGLAFLEWRACAVTAPNLLGPLILYGLGCALFLVGLTRSMRRRDRASP
jgi:hypothetical protein